MAGTIGDAQGTITVETGQAVSAINDLAGSISKLDAAAGAGKGIGDFNQSTVGMAQGMQNVGRAAGALGVGIAAPFVAAGKAAIDFESQMAGVNAVMDLQGSQFQNLNDLALKLGKDTVFSATEAAQGIETLGKAGVQYEDIMGGAADASTNLAAAAETSVPRAAEIISAALNAYSLSGSEATQVSDMLAGAANSSLADLEDLGIGFGQVAGAAAALGVPMDELITQLAIMTDMGLSGSDAATSIKTALNSLVAPIGAAAEEQGKLGISFRDSNGEFIGIKDTASLLIDTYDALGYSQADILGSVKALAGQDGYRALLFAMQEVEDERAGNTKGWDEYSRAVHEVGAAEKLATERMDSTAGSIEKLKGSIETLSILAGGTLATAIRGPIDAADALIDAMASIPAPILGAVAAIGAAVGGIVALGGAVTVAAGYVLEGVARLAAAGVTFDVIAAGALRVAAAISGIIAVAAALKFAWDNNIGGIQDTTLAFLDNVGNTIQAIQNMKDAIGADGSSYKSARGGMAADIEELATAIRLVTGIDITGAAGRIADFVQAMEKAADTVGIWTRAWNNADDSRKDINSVARAVLTLGRTIDTIFGTDFSDAFDVAANAIQEFVDVFNFLQTRNFNGVGAAITALGVTLEDFFGTNTITNGLKALGGAIAVFGMQMDAAIKSGINPFAAAILGVSEAAKFLGAAGLSEELFKLATAAQRFGNIFENNFGESQIDGMNGVSGALSALRIAMEQAFGLDISGFTDPAIKAIEAFTQATARAAQEGASPLQQAIAGLDALFDAFLTPEQQEMLDGISRGIQNIGNAARETVGSGLDRLSQFFNELGTAVAGGDFQGALNAVSSLITDIGTALQTAGSQALDWVLNVAAPTLGGWAAEQAGNFGGWLTEQIGVAGDLAGQVLGTIQNWFLEVGAPQLKGWVDRGAELVGPAIQALVNFAGQVLGTIQGWFLEVGAPVLRGWIEGGASLVGGEIQKLLNFTGETLGRVANWFLEVGAPQLSGVVVDLGGWLLGQLRDKIGQLGEVRERFANWFIEVGLPELTGAAQDLGGWLQQEIKTKVTQIGNITEQFTDWAIELAVGANPEAKINLDNLGLPALISAAIVTALGEEVQAINAAINTPGNMDSLAGGSNNVGAAIGEAIFGMIAASLEYFDDTLALPSNVSYAITVAAANLVEGVVMGFNDALSDAWNQDMPAGGRPGGAAGAQNSMADQFQSNFVDPLMDSFDALPGIIQSHMSSLGNPFLFIVQVMAGWVQELISGITDALSPLSDVYQQIPDEVLTALGLPVISEKIGFAGSEHGIAAGSAYADNYTTGFFDGYNAEFDSGIKNTPVGEAGPDRILGAESNREKQIQDALAQGNEDGTDVGGAYGEGVGNSVVPAAQSAMADSPLTDGLGNVVTNTLVGADKEIAQNGFPDSILVNTTEVANRKITDELGRVVDPDVIKLPKVGTGVGAGLATGLDADIAAGIDSATLPNTEMSVGSKVSEAAGNGVSNMGAQGADAARGGAAGAGSSIAAALDQVLATSIGGTTLQGFSQQIGVKIGEAITQGLSGASGAQGGRPGGAAGAADTSIGSSIANSLAASLAGADFSVVGTAIQTKISEALTAGLSAGESAPAGGSAAGIGASIATSLASSISGADFSAVGAAISAKISQSVSTATAGGGASGGRPGGAAGATGGGLGTAIAASIAGQIAGADFSAVGAAISAGIAGSMGTSLGPITEALSAVLSTVASGAASQAQSAMQPVGGAIASGIASGIGPGAGGVISAAQAVVTSAVSGASATAATANTVGTAFTTAVGSGIGSGTEAVTSAVQAATQAGIDAGTSTAAGATAIGEAITTNAGSGIGAGTGTLISAVQAMVQAAIDAGVGAAAGASAIGKAISDGAASGVIVTALNGVVAQMVANGIQAGMDEAAAASPSKKMIELGGWMSEGAAIGVEKKSTLFSKSMRRMVNDGMSSFAEIAKSGDIVKSFSSAFDDGAGGFVSFGAEISSLGDKIRASAENAASAMQDMIENLRKKIRDGRKGVKKDADSLASASSGVSKGAGGVASFNIDTKGLKGGVKDVLASLDEIGDASKDLRAYGEYFSQFVGGQEIAAQLTAMADDIDASKADAVESTNNLGKDINKVIKEIKKAIRAAAKDAGQSTGDGISEGMAASTPAAESAASATSDAAVKSLNANLTRLPEMAEAMGAKVGEALGTGVQDSLPAAEQAGADLVGALDTGIESMDNEISNAGGDAVNLATSAMDQTVTNNTPVIESLGTELGEALNIGLEAAKSPEAAFNAVKNMHDSITQSVRGAIPSVQTEGKALGDAMATGITQSNPTEAGKSLVGEATSGITTGTATGSKTAKNAGTSIGSSLQSGINAACAPVNKTATDLTDSCIPDGIDAGKDVAVDTASDAGQDVSNALVKGMEIKKKDANKAFDLAGKGLGDAIKSGIGARQNDAVQQTGKVLNAAGNVSGKQNAIKAGSSIVDGIVEGIKNGTSRVTGAVESAIQAGIDAANKKAKSASPSKVFQEIGGWLMEGAANGVDDKAHLLAEATARATQNSIELFQGAGMIAATRQMDRAMDGYSERVSEAIYDMNKAVEGAAPRAWMNDAPVSWDMREAQAELSLEDHDDVPPIQIGDVILKEGDRGYEQGRQLVQAMRGIAGQYRPS